MRYSRFASGAAIALIAAVAGPAHAAACMNSDPSGWLTSTQQRSLYQRLVSYLSCPDDAVDGPLADVGACNYFVGRVISDVYGVADFQRRSGGWLTANEIADRVAAPDSGWSLVGSATNQEVLGDAMRAANDGSVVIAVQRGAPGHVALVLPGELKASGNWGRNVPNSASFFLDDVEKAYVFCRLSYAFTSPSGVQIYRRSTN